MRSERAGVALLLFLALAPGAGCTRSIQTDSVVDARPAAERELVFWQRLETRRTITINDALHGLILLRSGKDPHATFGERLAEAKGRGWIAEGATPDPNESASMGLVAVAACDILGIRGGVTMRVLGPGPRYATREVVYRGLTPPRTPNQALSGLEFIDIVGRIEDRLVAGGSP
jgi:hypothetical protein